MKPKQELKPGCTKHMVKKYRVRFEEQWRDFNTIDEARDYAVSALKSGTVIFMSIDKVKVEVKDC